MHTFSRILDWLLKSFTKSQYIGDRKFTRSYKLVRHKSKAGLELKVSSVPDSVELCVSSECWSLASELNSRKSRKIVPLNEEQIRISDISLSPAASAVSYSRWQAVCGVTSAWPSLASWVVSLNSVIVYKTQNPNRLKAVSLSSNSKVASVQFKDRPCLVVRVVRVIRHLPAKWFHSASPLFPLLLHFFIPWGGWK